MRPSTSSRLPGSSSPESWSLTVLLLVSIMTILPAGASPAHGAWRFLCTRSDSSTGGVWCALAQQQLLITAFADADERSSAVFTLPLFPGDGSLKELLARVDDGDWMRLDGLPTSDVIPRTPTAIVLEAMRRGRTMTVRWFWPTTREAKGELRLSLRGFTAMFDAVQTTLEAHQRQPRRKDDEIPEHVPVPSEGIPVLRAT